jgi:hypothetical protein
VEFSLSVKVIVAVSPALRAVLLLEIKMVGAMVSIVSGVASEAAALALPAASVRPLAATETWPGVVDSAVGVNVAV